MNLSEAYKKANDDDELMSILEDGEEFEASKKDLENIVIPLSHAINDRWQIIPAKKEPVTASKYVKRYKSESNYNDWNDYDLTLAFKAGEENHDLLYDDLIDVVKKYLQLSETYGGIAEIVELRKIMKTAFGKITQHKETNGNN